MKVVISGGSSGIGLALAKLLAGRGDSEVFTFDLQSPPEKVMGVCHVPCDVADGNAVKAAFEFIGGNLDLLVNNAGIIVRGDLFDSTEQDFERLFRVNVKGSWLMIKEARPFFSFRPTIVQMSSGHALTPPKDPGLYTWTKQTLAILVENLRRDYPEYCIKATFLGPVDTPLAHVGLTEAAVEDKKKIMHSATYVADKIAHLIDSDKNDLLFDEAKWDYRFA